MLETCYHCKATSAPVQSRKVSISSINRLFNDVVCIDHFFLDQVCVFHVMDSVSRYSACHISDSTSIDVSILSFEASWMSQFWPPTDIQGDNSFNKTRFIQFLRELGTEFRPIPARIHSKNAIESKLGIIRSVFLWLKAANDTVQDHQLVYQAVRISNQLYGSDTLSAFEMDKGYTVPVTAGTAPNLVPDELISAQQALAAKRKMILILRLKAPSVPAIADGDIVQVYVKSGNEKRGKWLSTTSVIRFDPESVVVTVNGGQGNRISAAVEDVRLAVEDDEFADHVQEGIDRINQALEDLISCTENPTVNEDTGSTVDDTTTSDANDADKDDNECFYLSTDQDPTTSDHIEVYWPLDDTF